MAPPPVNGVTQGDTNRNEAGKNNAWNNNTKHDTIHIHVNTKTWHKKDNIEQHLKQWQQYTNMTFGTNATGGTPWAATETNENMAVEWNGGDEPARNEDTNGTSKQG